MRCPFGTLSVRVAVVLSLSLSMLVGSRGAPLAAQQPDDAGPRFLLAAVTRGTPPAVADVSRVPMLRRRVTLELTDVPVKDALAVLGRQARVAFVYNVEALPAERRVSVRAAEMTVAAVLTDVLLDAKLDVVLSGSDRLTLVPKQEPAAATGAIVGRVTDGKTGVALVGATVAVEGTSRSASSGGDGRYRIAEVPVGIHTVRARYIGYGPAATSVTVDGDQEATADFMLEKSVQRLDDVVTTGTVIPTEVKELPTPITVVTADDIQRMGIVRVDQLFRGTVPGGVAWDQGPTDYYSTIALRGSSSLLFNSVKTYVDGVEVTDYNLVATIDPHTIERIEILRGPQASAVYGAGAISGVIQIFTKKGRPDGDRPHIEGSAALGGIQSQFISGAALRQEYNLGLNGGTPAFTYQAQGSERRTGEWVPNFGDRTGALSGGARFTQGPLVGEFSLRRETKFYTREYDIRLRDLGYSYWLQPPTETDVQRQQGYGLKLKLAATSFWEHNLTVGTDMAMSEYYDRPTPAKSALTLYHAEATKTSMAYNTTVKVALGRAVTASVTAGADYYEVRNTNVGTSDASANIGPIDGTSLFASRAIAVDKGGFVQARVGISDALFLSGALRAERNGDVGKAVGTPLMPRIGLAYTRPFSGVTVKGRFSYGEAIRAPAPGAGLSSVSETSVSLANPNLRPERQQGWDGGIELYAGTRYSLSATYYRQRAIDLIEVTLLPPDAKGRLIFEPQNVGRIDNEGFEFEGGASIGPLQANATLSITTSKLGETGPSYTGDLLPGDRMLEIPHTSFGGTLSWAVGAATTVTGTVTGFGHWIALDGVALYGYYFGALPYRGSIRDYWIEYPSVTKFGLSVTQKLGTALTAYARIDNLTDVRRFEQNNVTLPMGRLSTVGLRFRY